MDGFPAAHVRVVACTVEGDDAYVVLDTGPAGYPDLYGSTVTRDTSGWRAGISGNGGSGWSATDAERELGTAYPYGDDAPAGADRVRATLAGETREAPVRDGVYLVAWWRVPPDAPGPWLRAFRVDGEWVVRESTPGSDGHR